jgi:hypothetical protein
MIGIHGDTAEQLAGELPFENGSGLCPKRG